MKRTLLTLTLVTFCLFGIAQTAQQEQIQALKDGLILVRLKTKEHTIKKMREKGLTKEAERKAIKQHDFNMNIVRSFNVHYNYSSVLFFYSRHSDEIKTGNYVGFLLDSNLIPIKDIDVDSNKTFVVDVGDVFIEIYGTHFEGLLVMDTDFEPLEKPFPYVIRRRSGLAIIQRTEAEMVMKLNKKLNDYLNKVHWELEKD